MTQTLTGRQRLAPCCLPSYFSGGKASETCATLSKAWLHREGRWLRAGQISWTRDVHVPRPEPWSWSEARPRRGIGGPRNLTFPNPPEMVQVPSPTVKARSSHFTQDIHPSPASALSHHSNLCVSLGPRGRWSPGPCCISRTQLLSSCSRPALHTPGRAVNHLVTGHAACGVVLSWVKTVASCSFTQAAPPSQGGGIASASPWGAGEPGDSRSPSASSHMSPFQSGSLPQCGQPLGVEHWIGAEIPLPL